MFTTTQTESTLKSDAAPSQQQSTLERKDEIKTSPHSSLNQEAKRHPHPMSLDFVEQPGSLTDEDDYKTALISSSVSPTNFRDKLLTEKEKEWRDKYFEHAVSAIKEGNIAWLTLIMGPERYYAWVEYHRHKHEAYLPRLSTFFDYAFEFIKLYEEKQFAKLYEEKLELDAQFVEYKKIIHGEKIAERVKNEEQFAAIEPGLLDASIREARYAMQNDDICTAYEEALKAYGEEGIIAYSNKISAPKEKIKGIKVSPSTGNLQEQFQFELSKYTHYTSRCEQW